jgi:hypothetical protein
VIVEVTLIPCKGEPTAVKPSRVPRHGSSKLPKLPKHSRGR